MEAVINGKNTIKITHTYYADEGNYESFSINSEDYKLDFFEKLFIRSFIRQKENSVKYLHASRRRNKLNELLK